MKITVTEALAEIKTISKRVEKKFSGIGQYVALDGRLKDPFGDSGGCAEFIKRERQGINDLQERLIILRGGISKKSHEVELEILGVKRTVAGWLAWKKDIASFRGSMLDSLSRAVASVRKEGAKQQKQIKDSESTSTISDIVIYINESELHKEIEQHQQILGELDGKLSLLNATTFIEV